LKGYDTDEYLISTYQTANIRWRNYHKGFTYLIVKHGTKVFEMEGGGRGMSRDGKLNLWDEKYTASDKRSNYLGKK
jgi:hypothetical protein